MTDLLVVMFGSLILAQLGTGVWEFVWWLVAVVSAVCIILDWLGVV